MIQLEVKLIVSLRRTCRFDVSFGLRGEMMEPCIMDCHTSTQKYTHPHKNTIDLHQTLYWTKLYNYVAANDIWYLFLYFPLLIGNCNLPNSTIILVKLNRFN